MEQQGATTAAARAAHAPYQFCTLSVVRQSPFGQFYLPDPVKASQPYAFDYDYTDVVRMAQVAEAKRSALQPAAVPVPAVPDLKSPSK